jgi:GR25 family glycosyltransferase involved in LPS biosynthesis
MVHHLQHQMGFLPNQFRRIQAIYNKKCGAIGCLQSHIVAIETHLASDRKDEPVILLEDDFEFQCTIELLSARIESVTNHQPYWNVLLFAGNNVSAIPIVNSTGTSVHRVFNSQTSSGYMIHPLYCKILIDVYKRTLTDHVDAVTGMLDGPYVLDQYWKKYQQEDCWFAYIPFLGRQLSGYSDIENQWVNYRC